MGFTTTYLEMCWKGRELWSGKSTQEGDWYISGAPLELSVVGHSELEKISFSDSSIAFVPDTDDLLEIIDNQIEYLGSNPEEKVLKIEYNPDGGWELKVEYGDYETVARGQESIHSLLVQAMFQMARPPP